MSNTGLAAQCFPLLDLIIHLTYIDVLTYLQITLLALVASRKTAIGLQALIPHVY